MHKSRAKVNVKTGLATRPEARRRGAVEDVLADDRAVRERPAIAWPRTQRGHACHAAGLSSGNGRAPRRAEQGRRWHRGGSRSQDSRRPSWSSRRALAIDRTEQFNFNVSVERGEGRARREARAVLGLGYCRPRLSDARQACPATGLSSGGGRASSAGAPPLFSFAIFALYLKYPRT